MKENATHIQEEKTTELPLIDKEAQGMRAYWLPKHQFFDWPPIGTHVFYAYFKKAVKPERIWSGVVIGERGEIKEHSTGEIHYPYLSDIFLPGTKISEVRSKLI